MAAVVWRVEFDRAAARDLRKLGAEAERRMLICAHGSPAVATPAG